MTERAGGPGLAEFVPLPTEAAPAALVARLPWLAPDAASLLALARPVSEQTWATVRDDPAAVFLLLRSPTGHATGADVSRSVWLEGTTALELALDQLAWPPTGILDRARPEVHAALRAALTLAALCQHLARETGRAAPDRAWVAGLLAALGRLAAAALGEEGDPAALARRLARQWRLPAWAEAVAGHLALPADVAVDLGAEPSLFRLTRLAVTLLRDHGTDLGLLPATCTATAEAAEMGLTPCSGWLTHARRVLDEPPAPPEEWRSPYDEPLLRDLLRLAVENRRLRQTSLLERMQEQVDRLERALVDRAATEAERLRNDRLTALAEFAAGAGHEINNPLAVISGQAQYLLGHAGEWFQSPVQEGIRSALQTIIGQTRRIHGLLRDLMAFARPAPPKKVWFDLAGLVAEQMVSLKEQAEHKRVRLDLDAGDAAVPVIADPEQVRIALSCLVRNAVEAAPGDGWVRVAVGKPDGGWVEVAVEDSGPGPAPEWAEAMFDPLFSGRSAGRGKGLGLPTAWRLARQQGGEIRLTAASGGQPARFVFRLPWSQPALSAPDVASPWNGFGSWSGPLAATA